MTQRLPTGRAGQALALVFVILVGLVVWAAIVVPLRAVYVAQAGRLEQRAALAQRMADLAARLPELRQQAATAAGTAAVGLFPATSDALVAATLQEAAQKFASAAGATLSSAETLPIEAVGAHRRIGLRVSLTDTLPVLVDLMARIEQAQPAMLTDALEIHAAPVVWAGQAPALSASFTVYGFSAPAGSG